MLFSCQSPFLGLIFRTSRKPKRVRKMFSSPTVVFHFQLYHNVLFHVSLDECQVADNFIIINNEAVSTIVLQHAFLCSYGKVVYVEYLIFYINYKIVNLYHHLASLLSEVVVKLVTVRVLFFFHFFTKIFFSNGGTILSQNFTAIFPGKVWCYQHCCCHPLYKDHQLCNSFCMNNS